MCYNVANKKRCAKYALENMTTDKKQEQERIAAIEAEEQATLLNQPKIDEDDETDLLIRIFPNAAPEHRLYIPGDPEFPGPPRSSSTNNYNKETNEAPPTE